MLIKFKNNRVRRSYIESGLINNYTEEKPLGYPEDWIASVITAFNPGFPEIENEGLSKFENDTLLKDYILSKPECLGKNKNIGILIKFLDAGERLVIQCHPTDDFAQKYFNSAVGKTECWYILDSKPEAHVYLGFNKKADKNKWKNAFVYQDINLMLSMLHKIKVEKGDCIFVNSGMPHAIGEGCFLIELQQPSDLMVIPERKTSSGRELDECKMHGGLGFERMFDCFDYQTYEKSEVIKKCIKKANLIENEIIDVIDEKFTDKFKLQQLLVTKNFFYENGDEYNVLVITEGEGFLSDGSNGFKIKKGDKFFVEANSKLKFYTENYISACICKH